MDGVEVLIEKQEEDMRTLLSVSLLLLMGMTLFGASVESVDEYQGLVRECIEKLEECKELAEKHGDEQLALSYELQIEHRRGELTEDVSEYMLSDKVSDEQIDKFCMIITEHIATLNSDYRELTKGGA